MQNHRQNCSSLYSNFYDFRQQTRGQRFWTAQSTISPWNIHRTLTTYYMPSILYCRHYMMAKQINFEHRISLFVTGRTWHILLFLQCAYAIVCIKTLLMLVTRGGRGSTGGLYKLAIQPVLFGIPAGDTRRNYQTEYSRSARRGEKRWVCICRTLQNWTFSWNKNDQVIG
jgi:hypothetical protein